MKKIAIIDYGLGNLRSVIRGLEKAGANAVITSDKEEIAAADGLVLPGVGAFHEGIHPGLGRIPGKVRRFPRGSGQKVPHMGWNSLVIEQSDNPLFAGFGPDEYVYFVHSFYADTSPEYTLTSTEYICSFSSSVGCGNSYGVQFHPEKSGAIGLCLLNNFIGMI
jgi:glutamine amidotransferase